MMSVLFRWSIEGQKEGESGHFTWLPHVPGVVGETMNMFGDGLKPGISVGWHSKLADDQFVNISKPRKLGEF